MDKYRMENPEHREIRKPKEITDPQKTWGYILYEGTKFFNSDYTDPKDLNDQVNKWIETEWIWDLRHPALGITDCRKIQKYLGLEILKISHNNIHINELPQGTMVGSVMIHFKITCRNIVYWDVIKKYFDEH